MIINELKEMKELQHNKMIQNIQQKEKSIMVSVNIYYLFFLRDMHGGDLSLKDAAEEHCQIIN